MPVVSKDAIPTMTADLPIENQVYLLVRETWAAGPDQWDYYPGLIVERLERNAASVGRDRLTFSRKYGRVREPFDLDWYDAEKFEGLDGWWVQLMQPVKRGAERPEHNGKPRRDRVLFRGRVETPIEALNAEKVEDESEAEQPAGVQTWISRGGRGVLERIDIHDASWLTDGKVVRLDRCPEVNTRGGDPRQGGNRSAIKAQLAGSRPVYHFGGTKTWNTLQLIEYLLESYVFAAMPGGPYFELAGDVEALAALEPRLSLSSMGNVADAIDALIDPRRGLDWLCRPTPNGWEVYVYSLLPATDAFTDLGFPVNEAITPIYVTDRPDIECEVERGGLRAYDRIRVRGAFTTMTFTVGDTGVANVNVPLWGDWTAAEQTAYEDGDTQSGSPTAEDHDAARTADRFAAVFQRFRVPPDTFDYDGGALNPVFVDVLDPEAALATDRDRYQTNEIGTLALTPLRVGLDYTTDPPTDRNRRGMTQEYQPLMVWAYVESLSRYVPIDRLTAAGDDLANCHVKALEHGIGMLIESSPNHQLARDTWGVAAAASRTVPMIDWRALLATLTIETDHRVALDVALPAAAQAGDGSVSIINAGAARLDVLAPNTIVDIDDGGSPEYSPGAFTILHDGRALLKELAAGAAARYLHVRERAKVTVRGRIGSWDDTVGTILQIDGELKRTRVLAPITSVVIDFERNDVTILCGQAGR